MALFVRASRIAPMEEQALPPLAALSSAKPAMRGPGFFGRLGNRLRNADWQMAFAQMRDDPSFAENLLAHRENAAEQARREAEAESARRAAKGVNADREAYINTLDPQAALAFRAGIEPPPPITPYQREQLDLTRRGQDISAARGSGGGDGGVYRVLSPQEVQARGLPPGSYQLNERTNQVVPIGRVRSQYTEFAGQSAQFANRMAAADETLRELEASIDPALVYGTAWGGGSSEVRRIRQAQREFVNAILRRESGAAIQQPEFDSARQQYFPVPGDGPEVIEQKRQARQRAIQGLQNASQGAYEEWYGGDGQQSARSVGPPSGEMPSTGGSSNNRRRGPLGRERTFNPATGRLE